MTFASDAYAVPPLPGAASGGTTNGVASDPSLGDAHEVAQDICDAYLAKFERAYASAGSFSCAMSENQTRAMSHDPRVVCVEADAYVYADFRNQPTDSWALERIDRQPPDFSTLPGSTTFTQNFVTNNNGTNGDVWIVDSGVWAGGNDLKVGVASRVFPEFPKVASDLPDVTDVNHQPYTTSDDDDGHGTAVASLAAGNTYGVADAANIHAVKVLGWNAPGVVSSMNAKHGTVNSVVAGLNYIADHGVPTVNHRRSVVNMSLGFSIAGYLTQAQQNSMAFAVKRLTDMGITVVVSAGNNQVDASDATPACLSATNPGVITVGAMNYYNGDMIATYNDPLNPGSNFGSCVDLFAPGLGVPCVYFTGSGSARTQVLRNDGSGTSVSAPLVTGVALLTLQTYWGNTPAQVKAAVLYQTYGKHSPNSAKVIPAGLIDFSAIASKPGASATLDRILNVGPY